MSNFLFLIFQTDYPVHETPTMRKRTPSGRFMDTINPLMSFSTADIADMDKEVDNMLDDESESDESESEGTEVQQPVTLNKGESSSSEESLTGEHIRGHKRKREGTGNESEDDPVESSLDEYPSVRFRRGETLESDLDFGQDSNSERSEEAPDDMDDGEWNMMGAALEREFLSNE